jgi:hypothetical protein
MVHAIVASAYFAADAAIVATRSKGAATDVDPVRLEGATDPETDLDRAAGKILDDAQGRRVAGVCLLCPGPFVTIDKSSPDYGRVSTTTSARKWEGVHAIDLFRDRLIAYGYDGPMPRIIAYNQAGGTAMGDYFRRYGPALAAANSRGAAALAAAFKALGNHLYIVADEGIGAGLIVNGEPFHGESTLDVGHQTITVMENTLPKRCPLHPRRPCLNSVASLSAIRARWGMENEDFVRCADPEKVGLIARYIAQMLSNVVLTLSPKRIVVGGRIAANELFLPALREELAYHLSIAGRDDLHPGYFQRPDLSRLILSQTDRHCGVRGGLMVIERALALDNEEASGVIDLGRRKGAIYPYADTKNQSPEDEH